MIVSGALVSDPAPTVRAAHPPCIPLDVVTLARRVGTPPKPPDAVHPSYVPRSKLPLTPGARSTWSSLRAPQNARPDARAGAGEERLGVVVEEPIGGVVVILQERDVAVAVDEDAGPFARREARPEILNAAARREIADPHLVEMNRALASVGEHRVRGGEDLSADVVEALR